jgi:hypothetical protein
MAESALAHLRTLADQPAEQFALALKVVAKERNPDAVIAAAKVLELAGDERARPALLGRYEHCAHDGAHRDPAGTIRIALLRALRSVALPDDAPLFARAASTYEFRFGEVAGDLRAAGLLALGDIDQTSAGFHAVRLLYDPHVSRMSGEPAVTAARVLADLGQPLPLYACVIRESELPSEVLGECLRGLTEMPAGLVRSLVEGFRDSRDEVLLLGLYDLLLEHPARDEFAPIVRDFLHTTPLIDLYASVVATLVAKRDPDWLEELRRLERDERNRERAAVLRATLPPR